MWYFKNTYNFFVVFSIHIFAVNKNCVDVSRKGSAYNIVALHKMDQIYEKPKFSQVQLVPDILDDISAFKPVKKVRRLCQIKLFTINSLDLLQYTIGLFSFSLDNCQPSELFIVATKWLIFGFLDF